MSIIWIIGLMFTFAIIDWDEDLPWYKKFLLPTLIFIFWPCILGLIAKQILSVKQKEPANGEE